MSTNEKDYLVIYMSRHGTTEKVATEIRDRLGADITVLVNLEDQETPNLNDFHCVIIGGSVHAGTIQGKLMSFCQRHTDELLNTRLGLFMCFMNDDLKEMEFEDSFPLVLRAHAVAKGMFGGEFLLEKMSFLERTAVRKIKGIDTSVSRLDQNAIDKFIEEIQT